MFGPGTRLLAAGSAGAMVDWLHLLEWQMNHKTPFIDAHVYRVLETAYMRARKPHRLNVVNHDQHLNINWTNLLRRNGPWIGQCTGGSIRFGDLFSEVTPWGTLCTISQTVSGSASASWNRHGRARISACTQNSTRSYRAETTRSSHARRLLSLLLRPKRWGSLEDNRLFLCRW